MGEQDRPLAPAATQISAEENGIFSTDQKQDPHRRKGVICCGCCAITIVIIGLVILILAFTVFKVKSPKITISSVTVKGLDAALKQGGTIQPGLNMSFISDISIKNPNSASFKFTNATTQLYYGGVVIGEVWSPPGNAGAHKTIHMNVTIDVMIDTLSRVSRFPSDVISGQMPMGTYTDIHGRVNVMNIIKKHIDMKLNCTMIVVISTQSIKDKVCKRTVHI